MSFPSKVAFRAPNGQFFRAEGGGGQIITTSGTSISSFETFTIIDRGNNQIALQVNNGMYVTAANGVGSPLLATATTITSTEIFTVIDRGAGQVALRAQSGMYLHADSAGVPPVYPNATAISPTETFGMIDPGTQIAPRFGAYDYSAPINLPAPGRGVISFTVTAQNNVYVGISSYAAVGSPMYEIVFSGPGGATILRRGAQGPVLASISAGLLSPGGSNQLWVAIDATTQMIQAGRGAPGQDPILSFRDPQFLSAAQIVVFSCWDTPISLANVQTRPVMMAALFSDSPATAVHLGNPPKLNIQNRISIAAWVFPTADDGYRDIVARGYQLSPNGEVFLRILWGSYQLGSLDGLGAHMISVAIPAGDLGTWVHLAGVYDGSKWILYRNGVSIGQLVDPIGAVPVNGGWSIGTRGDFLERSFRGRISAVSIWNTAIDATLLQACMTSSLIGFEPGLCGYWPLNDGIGTVALDKAAAPANGNVVMAIWSLCDGPTLPAAPPVVAPSPPPPTTPVLGTTTITVQPSTGLVPPTGDATIDSQLSTLAQTGVPFSIFGVPFTMPLHFSGALKTTFTADTADIIGSAHLDSPFSTDLGQLEVKLNRTPGSTAAYLRFDLPLSLSTIVQNQVQPRVPSEAWTAIDLLAMPLVRSFDSPTVVLSPLDSTDPALPGPIVKGINFYKSIVLSSIEPFTTLNNTFSMLHLEQRTIGVHLGIGSDNGATNWQGDLALVLNQSLGTDAVVFNSISMTVKPGLTKFETGVKALLTVRVSDSQTLQISGGVNLKQTQLGSSASIWGALDTPDGAWRDPMGLKGLTINGLGLEIGVASVAPGIVLGFRGGVMLGSSALSANLAFFFDPVDPGAMILQISSPPGIGLLTILKALLSSVFNPPSFFDISITDLNFYVAPKGGSIAGKTYPKGTQLGGKLNLFGYHAAIDGRIDYSSGASLHGTMDRISLKTGSVTFLELTDASGNGNPTVDIDVNAQKQGIHISGRVRVFNNFYNEAFEADVGSSGVLIKFSSSAGGIFASTSLKLDRSGFALNMEPSFNFGFTLFGVSLSVGIQATIAIAITESSFSQTIGFKFSAFGQTLDAGSITLNVPICTIDDLRDVFEQFADVVKDFFTNQIKNGVLIAVTWLHDNLVLAVSEAGQLMREAGVALADAANTIVNVIGAAVSDAVLAVARTVDEARQILSQTFHLVEAQIQQFLNSVGAALTGDPVALGTALGLTDVRTKPMMPGAFDVANNSYENYHKWLFDTPGSGAICFNVGGNGAAMIAFSSSSTPVDPMAVIELGMENNTKFYLRRAHGGPVFVSVPAVKNLSDRLWIGIDNQFDPPKLQVGRGPVGTNVICNFPVDHALIANAQYVLMGVRTSGLVPGNALTYSNVTSCPVETRLAFSTDVSTAVQLGNPSKLDIKGPITISAWIRPLAKDGYRNIVARGYKFSPAGEVFLRIHDGYYQVGSYDGLDHLASAPIPPADMGNWVHLTGTYDGTAWTLYRNGFFMARQVDAVGAVAVSGGWAIGSAGDRSERTFLGNIAEVTIWNKAIDTTTINTLVSIDAVVKSMIQTYRSGLMGYWPLGLTDGGSNALTRDLCGFPFVPSMVGADGVQGPTPQGVTNWTLVPPIPRRSASAVSNATSQSVTRPLLVTKTTFPWTGLGGSFEGNPSITSWGPGRLDVFTRGGDNVLYHIAYEAAWRFWEGLGGQMTGDPSACSGDKNLIDIWVFGFAKDACRKWFDGSNWQGYGTIGGSFQGSPVGLARTGHKDCFALGTDKAIWWCYQNATWSPLISLGGGLLDPPAVIYRNGRYDVFARGTNTAAFQCTNTTGSFGSWNGLGGSLIGQLAAVSTATGCFDLFGRGTDQRIWTLGIGGQSAGGWISLASPSGPDPGAVLTDPVAISISPDRVDLLVVGADQGLWHRRRLAGVWQSWRRLGALPVRSKPAVTSSAVGHLDIAVFSTDKSLWHYRMDD